MKANDVLGDLVADVVIMAALTTTASSGKRLIVVLPIICRLPIIFIIISLYSLVVWYVQQSGRIQFLSKISTQAL
jgi:hypothetical protein